MAIVDTDILVKLSVTTGSAGNSVAQGNPNLSLGKYISTSQWVGGTLHDLFDVITGDENAASVVDYRCVFIHNNHATISWLIPVIWISAEVSGGASVAIGVDPAGVTAIGASSAQAALIATELIAPSGVSFSSPTTKATGISLGASIPAGSCVAVWIRRTAANTAAIDADGATFSYAGDTTAA